MKRRMHTALDLEKKISDLFGNLRVSLEQKTVESTAADVQKFVTLGKNHLDNFKTRCDSKEKAFFHQHEKMRSLVKGSDGYNTAEELKRYAESKVKEYGQTALNAIQKDHDDIIKDIEQRPEEQNEEEKLQQSSGGEEASQ